MDKSASLTSYVRQRLRFRDRGLSPNMVTWNPTVIHKDQNISLKANATSEVVGCRNVTLHRSCYRIKCPFHIYSLVNCYVMCTMLVKFCYLFELQNQLGGE